MRKEFYAALLLSVCCRAGCPCSEAEPDSTKRFRLPELDAVVLGDTEVPSFTLELQSQAYWWIGQSPDGRGLSQPGVNQAFRDPQRRLLVITYARFRDSAEAHRAAVYHTKVVAAVFRNGLWEGWEKITIGDACWVPLSRTRAGLLVQKGTLCLLISCLFEDAEQGHRLAFSVAQEILAKEARRNKGQEPPEGDKGRHSA